MELNVSSESPRVLVVDDEPLLRSYNADMLSDAGYAVFEAANADEALAVLSAIDDIRVVFTDVEMPGTIDGFALAAAIRHRWPEIGVLVTSGGRSPDVSFEAPERCFVAKPYSTTQIIELIEGFARPRH